MLMGASGSFSSNHFSQILQTFIGRMWIRVPFSDEPNAIGIISRLSLNPSLILLYAFLASSEWKFYYTSWGYWASKLLQWDPLFYMFLVLLLLSELFLHSSYVPMHLKVFYMCRMKIKWCFYMNKYQHPPTNNLHFAI